MRISPSGQGVFGANGEARVTLGPVPWGQRWALTSVSVRTTSVAITQATVYRSTVSPTNQLDTTKRRGNGSTTDVKIDLHHAESVVVLWTGGDVGATATATAEGDTENV